MAIPTLFFVASASQGLPVIAAAVAGGRRPSVPHMRIAIMCAILVFSDAVSVLVGGLTGNNLWLQWFIMPAEVSMTFWILEAFHTSARVKRAYQVIARATPVLVGLALLLAPDTSTTFEQWISPSIALVALVGTVHALIGLSLGSLQPLPRQDWFWICFGLALFWLMYVPIAPFADALVGSNSDWVLTAYIARAWICVGAFALMAWGMVCSRVLARS